MIRSIDAANNHYVYSNALSTNKTLEDSNSPIKNNSEQETLDSNVSYNAHYSNISVRNEHLSGAYTAFKLLQLIKSNRQEPKTQLHRSGWALGG
jgi:hypothetical protein